MKRIFGTKKDKVPAKSLDDIGGSLDKRVEQCVSEYL